MFALVKVPFVILGKIWISRYILFSEILRYHFKPYHPVLTDTLNDHPFLPHLVAPWCCQFRGTSDLMPASFRDLRTLNAFLLTADPSSFTTSSGSKVNTRGHAAVPQSRTARSWELLPNNAFWKTASTCHEITASQNLRGDYHLTISPLSLIPLLEVNCLTYDGGEDCAVRDAHVHGVFMSVWSEGMMAEWAWGIREMI